MEKPEFNKRSFTSILIALNLLIMGISGLVLFFVPEGRVAYWVHWNFLGLSKGDWGDIHIVAGLLFVLVSLFHIYFNWKIFMNYFEKKFSSIKGFNREVLVAVVVSLVVLFGTIFHIPPFGTVLDIGEKIKDYWSKQENYSPPYGHAELSSLKSLANMMDIDLEKASEYLKQKGIKMNSVNDSLETIGRTNNLTPKDIYSIIKVHKIKIDTTKLYTSEDVEKQFLGKGLGKKTLKGLSDELGKELAEVEKTLKEKGIDFSSNSNMNEIAQMNQIKPMDVLKIILIEDFQIK